ALADPFEHDHGVGLPGRMTAILLILYRRQSEKPRRNAATDRSGCLVPRAGGVLQGGPPSRRARSGGPAHGLGEHRPRVLDQPALLVGRPRRRLRRSRAARALQPRHVLVEGPPRRRHRLDVLARRPALPSGLPALPPRAWRSALLPRGGRPAK